MLKNFAGHILFFVVVFNLISWIRETSLLDNDVETPAFQLMSVDGEQINSDDLKGKATLLYFWAPWCNVCHVSLPNLQEFYEENKTDINVVSVVLSYEDISDVHISIVDHQLQFPTLLGNIQVAEDYKVSGFPTYYLLDEEGKVVSKSLGYSTQLGMELRAFIL